jgi:hypothetical protein
MDELRIHAPRSLESTARLPPADAQRMADERVHTRSDQRGALADRVTSDDVHFARDEASRYSGGQPEADEVVADRVANDVDAGGARVGVAERDVGECHVSADVLKSTPSQLVFSPLIVRLPPIVLFLIDQGIGPPPPIRVTFPLTLIPFSRTCWPWWP